MRFGGMVICEVELARSDACNVVGSYDEGVPDSLDPFNLVGSRFTLQDLNDRVGPKLRGASPVLGWAVRIKEERDVTVFRGLAVDSVHIDARPVGGRSGDGHFVVRGRSIGKIENLKGISRLGRQARGVKMHQGRSPVGTGLQRRAGP